MLSAMRDRSTVDKQARARQTQKLRFSIVYSLNIRLLLRTILIFLLIDLLLVGAVIGGGWLNISHEATRLIDRVYVMSESVPTKSLDNETMGWIEAAGWSMERLDRAPVGEPVDADGRASIWEGRPNRAENLTIYPIFRQAIAWPGQLELHYEFIAGGQTYGLYKDLSHSLLWVAGVAIALYILQILILIFGFFSRQKLFRQKLRPFADLVEAAENLSAGDQPFKTEDMEELADQLDRITATRLDTRIPLSQTGDELRSLAGAINGMLERINSAYSAQVRFVSDASHELRTPISVIEGYANLLDRWGKNDPATLQESIDAIKEEAANMKSLVEQLLFLARGDTNTMALHKEFFDLAELGAELHRESQMIDQGHDFSGNFQSAPLIADRGLIKQAARILLDNAVKYTPAGGKIQLSVQKDPGGQAVRLSVQDNGMGIPAEAVSKIFDRFYRTDESRARSTGGTGLGLAIARWIVERHGGYLEVLSREGIGTRMSISIPGDQDAGRTVQDSRSA